MLCYEENLSAASGPAALRSRLPVIVCLAQTSNLIRNVQIDIAGSIHLSDWWKSMGCKRTRAHILLIKDFRGIIQRKYRLNSARRVVGWKGATGVEHVFPGNSHEAAVRQWQSNSIVNLVLQLPTVLVDNERLLRRSVPSSGTVPSPSRGDQVAIYPEPVSQCVASNEWSRICEAWVVDYDLNPKFNL